MLYVVDNVLPQKNRQCKRANAFMLYRCPLDHIPFVIFFMMQGDWAPESTNLTMFLLSVGHWLLESWWILKEPFFVCLFVIITIYITWTDWRSMVVVVSAKLEHVTRSLHNGGFAAVSLLKFNRKEIKSECL